MKLFKIIINCVVIIVLILSITINFFLFYTIARFINTDITVFKQVRFNYVLDKGYPETSHGVIQTIPPFNPHEEIIEVKPAKKAFYQDDYIKVTCVGSEESTAGPIHKFEIENTSNRQLTILFTDLYINGHMASSSGLTCEKLDSRTKVIADLYLLTCEWENVTDSPTEVTFRIKLVNPNTWLDIFESERLIFKI